MCILQKSCSSEEGEPAFVGEMDYEVGILILLLPHGFHPVGSGVLSCGEYAPAGAVIM